MAGIGLRIDAHARAHGHAKNARPGVILDGEIFAEIEERRKIGRRIQRDILFKRTIGGAVNDRITDHIERLGVGRPIAKLGAPIHTGTVWTRMVLAEVLLGGKIGWCIRRHLKASRRVRRGVWYRVWHRVWRQFWPRVRHRTVGRDIDVRGERQVPGLRASAACRIEGLGARIGHRERCLWIVLRKAGSIDVNGLRTGTAGCAHARTIEKKREYAAMPGIKGQVRGLCDHDILP